MPYAHAPTCQVFVGGKSIGGSDDLSSALASGEFQKQLADAQARKASALPPELVQVVRLQRLHTHACLCTPGGVCAHEAPGLPRLTMRFECSNL